MDDNLQRRGNALEDLFFQQRDRQLMEQLSKELADTQARTALAQVSGISNEQVLQALVNQNIGPGNMICLTMVPLVQVAWADGEVQPDEAAAIRRAANENGVKSDSASGELLNRWLARKPPVELYQAWKLYLTSIKTTLDEASFRQVAEAIWKRAETVAHAAGGFLGIGSTSVSEKKVLDELKSLLHI